MRGAGFGLVGLLLCGAIIFYMMWGEGGSAQTSLEAKKHSEEIVNKVSGRDEQGAAVTAAISFEDAPKGLLVKSITPGSALEKKYGLKVGDIVLEAGPLELKAQPSPQESIQLAYARDDTLVVMRGVQKITLPNDRNVGVAPPTPSVAIPTPAPAPADTTPPAPPVKRTNPQGQAHDLLKKIESH